MKPNELVLTCVERINGTVSLGFPASQAAVAITTPKGWKAPPKFPRGRIVQVKEDGTRVRYVNAVNLLAWLTANGFAKLAD